MARLFADENFLRRISEALRQLGHDVLTIQEASYGNQRTEDDNVLQIARPAKNLNYLRRQTKLHEEKLKLRAPGHPLRITSWIIIFFRWPK